jgi:hypothetical protein
VTAVLVALGQSGFLGLGMVSFKTRKDPGGWVTLTQCGQHLLELRTMVTQFELSNRHTPYLFLHLWKMPPHLSQTLSILPDGLVLHVTTSGC